MFSNEKVKTLMSTAHRVYKPKTPELPGRPLGNQAAIK